MRPIIFRVWDRKKKEMIYLKERREGDDYYIVSLLKDNVGWSVWKIKLNTSLEEKELLTNFETGILMQYTGIKDKNGKKIYEGDIVQQRRVWDGVTVRGEVIFKRGMFVVRRGEQDYLLDEETAEVIGNIYENPELLKERREK